MTLPSGGTISYGFTNFSQNRWLTSRTAGTGTWTSTPAYTSGCPSGTYTCQKVTVTAPDFASTVYTFGTNNGAWNTETDYWLGGVGGSGSRTVLTTWDFSNSCPLSGGAAYIRKLSQTNSEQSAGSTTLNKQTQYSYDMLSRLSSQPSATAN